MRPGWIAAVAAAALLSVAAPALGVPAQPPLPSPLPTFSPGPPWVPQPRPGKGMRRWLEHHEQYVARAHQGKIDVLFIGDSTVERFVTIGKAVWDERYAPLNAANFGISGDRTQFVLWRLQHGELQGIEPKLVVLEIGTNNVETARPASIVYAIGQIVAYVQQTLPDTKVLVIGLLPRGVSATNSFRPKITEVNRALASLAMRKNVSFIDVGASLLDTDGTLSPAVMPDGLHPSAYGYQLWADAMEPVVDSLLGLTPTPSP